MDGIEFGKEKAISMASVSTGFFENSPQFWDQFETIVPEAVRCRFLSTAMGIADARAVEYERESGPFLAAVKETHLPCALLRLDILKKEAQALVAVYSANDELIKRTSGLVSEALKLISIFQTEVVDPLDNVLKQGDEAGARNVVTSLVTIAAGIARAAEANFMRAVGELEQAVVNSVVYTGSLTGFVSCVSLDLAQYGAHARVLHDYTGAGGVFDLNRRIHSEIDAAVKSQGISHDDIIKIDTGDGAILIFTTKADAKPTVTDRAYRFSKEFLGAIAKMNKDIAVDNQLHFRVGICSGVIKMHNSKVRRSDIAQCNAGGVPLGAAVRLQAAARTGEIIACATTYDQLPQTIQNNFSPKKPIMGKPHEKTPIDAHRFACVPPRPEERDSHPA